MKNDKVWDGDMEMEGNKENGEVGREVSEIGVENRREDIRMCEKRVKKKKAERKGKKTWAFKSRGGKKKHVSEKVLAGDEEEVQE